MGLGGSWTRLLHSGTSSLLGRFWDFPKIRGTLFWGPYNKGPIYLGYYIRVPYFRKRPFCWRGGGAETVLCSLSSISIVVAAVVVVMVVVVVLFVHCPMHLSHADVQEDV